MMLLWYVLGSLFVGLALCSVAVRRPADPRPDYRLKPGKPDYRLIWDLEEELGFEHLDSERRPLRSWMVTDAPGQVIEVQRDAWDAWCAHCGGLHSTVWDCVAAGVHPLDADLAALEVQAWAEETQRANLRRARENALLSSVDQSLRVSGERGFL